ncbi:MAG: rhodanese-like domain-containing protein [Calditrichaeota bacterium]|nr:rhodanese-like domain-containing protein [Calditrichota bacterium]
MTRFFRYLLPVVLMGSLMLFVGCSDDDDSGPTGPSGPTLQEGMADVGDTYLTGGTKNITADALFADITAGVNLFMIDFRSATDYATAGHIANTVNWTIGNLPDNLSQIPSGAKVICVCYTGQTASWACSFLRMKGYDAYNVKWGMCGWTSDPAVNLNKWNNVVPNGGTLETTNNPLTTQYDLPTFTCNAGTVDGGITEECNEQFDAGLKYIPANDVYAAINDSDPNNDPFLLCYWTEAPYNLGHIPGSYRFEPGSLGREENLMYLPPDKQIVVYCYTGQTSAQVCTYLRMLGYNAYSMSFGMNAVTDRADILGANDYHAPTTDYPVVTGN